jgi:hypothetical protein
VSEMRWATAAADSRLSDESTGTQTTSPRRSSVLCASRTAVCTARAPNRHGCHVGESRATSFHRSMAAVKTSRNGNTSNSSTRIAINPSGDHDDPACEGIPLGHRSPSRSGQVYEGSQVTSMTSPSYCRSPRGKLCSADPTPIMRDGYRAGGSSSGRTTGSGPVSGGSNPPPPARFEHLALAPGIIGCFELPVLFSRMKSVVSPDRPTLRIVPVRRGA